MAKNKIKRPFSRQPGPALVLTELKSFWSSPAGALALLVFLGFGGFFLYNNLATYAVERLAAAAAGRSLDAGLMIFSRTLSQMPLAIMLVTPLTIMQALASSRRGGHLDFLQTLPLSDSALILGQYLAVLTSLIFLLILSLPPFLVLLALGVGHWELLLTGYLGLLMLAAAYGALGLLAAALCPAPLSAGLASFGFFGLWWVLGWAAPYLDYGLGPVLGRLAPAPRLDRLIMGLLEINDLIFFGVVTILALVNAQAALRLRRFSGAD